MEQRVHQRLTLGPVPDGCRARLVGHYGETVHTWLDYVPHLLGEAAEQWQVRLLDYHDAGHASALALGETAGGEAVLLKAWFDSSRFMNEIAALRQWGRSQAPGVRHADDERGVACLDVVGGRAAGAPRPAQEYGTVALALRELHVAGEPEAAVFPDLESYIGQEVRPRVLQRAQCPPAQVPERCVHGGLDALAALPAAERDAEAVLLHGDLYRENVLFDQAGGPVFIDPLPMVGPAAFDWAFWTVYYELARGQRERLVLARAVGGMAVSEVLPWCLTLCLDGMLYYASIHDEPRTRRMVTVMDGLREDWC